MKVKMEGIGVEFVDVTPEEFVRFLELINKMDFNDESGGKQMIDWGFGSDGLVKVMIDGTTGKVYKLFRYDSYL